MRRRVARPYGLTISVTRLASLIMAMAVLWMLYERLKDPATWRGFAASDESVAQPIENAPHEEQKTVETVVPGPNHQSEEELAAVQRMFEYVIDRSPLKPREMDAYWRLMAWSRTEPFADLEKQARRDVPFTQLWEQPERYRGQPIRLRLHVRRVLEYDAPENPHGITKVYEAWGWTDESRSFPYVVVFPERPEGLPVGTDIHGEIVFVGYFLKIMSYTAFEKTRGAPLLVGRAQFVASHSSASTKTDTSAVLIAVLVCGGLLVGSFVWIGVRPRRKSAAQPLPGELPAFGSLDSKTSSDEFFSIDLKSHDIKTESPDVGAPEVANPEALTTAGSGVSG